MGGYTIPLRIARDKLLVSLNYEFNPPDWASHHCDPGTKREGDTLKIHFNNYFSERKDLHPCYAYHPDSEIPGHMWIATHSEADWPDGSGNLQENEHDLKIKEFLLTEGKLDAKDLEWCCLWTKISTLREQALIPDTVPYEKMFWAKLNTVEEVKRYFENARRLTAEYYHLDLILGSTN
ncbi:hypothetical protein QCA50_011181 [Cerrena zonata]|uniref:Uncharacterized protein n=1 Tax=Cerrena zonata TaxID=2478898 RepID=A0AAW0G3W2_9APHY